MLPPSPLYNPMRRTLLGATALWGVSAPVGAAVGAKRRPQVAVVGAGMAGLSLAWELEQRGMAVTVLEAQDRLGGRNWTLRAGDVLPDMQGAVQTCSFDAGQHLQAGPWRITPQHRRVLALAQRLAVPLERVPSYPSGQALCPVGGMDALPQRLAQQLRAPVRLASPVRVVQHQPQVGVALGYGVPHALQWLEADFAVFTLPLHLLAALQWQGAAAELVGSSAASADVADAAKIAWQLSRAAPQWPAMQAGAPHWWLHWPNPRAVPARRIAAVYANGEALRSEWAGSRAQQLAFAQAQMQQALVAEVPGWAGDLSAGLVVQWSRVPYQQAAACRISAAQQQQLRQGVGPVLFAGDALSAYNGWQEGALQSARVVALAVQKRVDDLRGLLGAGRQK